MKRKGEAMPQTKKKPQPTPTSAVNGPVGEVLTLGEAAAYLRLPEADVLRLVDEQGLPARRLGNEWRFFKVAVQQWLSTPPPTPSDLLQANKDAWLGLAGKYKDDPDLLAICEETYRQRGGPIAEDE
jgi:excisionase family DNA binding protein